MGLVPNGQLAALVIHLRSGSTIPMADFNVIQSGHRWAVPNYEFITHDYDLKTAKPTIDMEARYENHPDGPNTEVRMDAHQEREAAYWAMLAGAAGHGYGCNDIWQLYNPERMPAADDQSFPFERLRGTTHWRKVDFECLRHGADAKTLELRPGTDGPRPVRDRCRPG
jgi:hypothetical protein